MLSVGPTDDVTNQTVRRMNKTLQATAGLAVDPYTSLAHSGQIASPSGRPSRVKPLMRRYEVAHLTPSLEIEEFSRMAPALPAFENAFAAIGRGAIVRTETGPMAVEDLLPGDRVMTSNHGFQTLLWFGKISIVPNQTELRPEMSTMTRITANSLGLGRPSVDLILGPSARMHYHSPALQQMTGTTSALVPVRDFIDGDQMIELRPATAVQAYHLGFAHHTCVNVNGIEIETLHAGPAHSVGIGTAMMPHFMALFPHVSHLISFGPLMAPRLRKADLDLVVAA